MRFSTPLLARYGEDAVQIPPGPLLIVGSDGLLRRENTGTPFIDELGRSPAMSCNSALDTMMTKAEFDPPDPDLVRRDGYSFACGLETIVTRAQTEPNDPDFDRADGIWAVITSYTNGGRDRPDPDTIRRL